MRESLTISPPRETPYRTTGADSSAVMPVDFSGGAAYGPALTQRTTDAPGRASNIAPGATELPEVTSMATADRAACDVYVRTHADASIFHTLAWCEAVAHSFPHQPCHLVARRNQNIVGVLPLFHVRSRLAGRLLVSVPYGVAGGILADDDATSLALLTAAKQLADEHRCRTMELRSRSAAIAGAPVDDRYVTFERELPDRPEETLAWLPRKARAAARQGRDKHGLSAEFGDHLLPDVWHLYARSMRRLASIAYPQYFLGRLLDATRHRHWVCLIRKDNRPVAGLVTFLFRDRVMPYFVGLSDDARNYSAANYLYFVTMQRAVEAGFRIFDFGRTRRDNRGSFDFKRFHGFEPTPLEYQRISFDGRPAPKLCPTDSRFALARRIWPLLPLRMTTWLGGALSRDIPG